jgi:DNA-binding YbaB/EbfC family protein
MRGALGNMMQQVQKMQENLQRAHEELARTEVTGEAGAGLVKVTVNGKHEARAVSIDPSLIGGDREMLEDLIVAAINDANNRLAEVTQRRMAEVTQGMPLPPGMKLPF